MNPINHALISNGWRQFPTPFREEKKTAFAKSFEGHAKCRCNAPKNKQVEIYHHHAQTINGHYLCDTWSVELVGELPDTQWLRMQVHSLTDLETIERTVKTLLSIWDHAVFITPYVPDDDD